MAQTFPSWKCEDALLQRPRADRAANVVDGVTATLGTEKITGTAGRRLRAKHVPRDGFGALAP